MMLILHSQELISHPSPSPDYRDKGSDVDEGDEYETSRSVLAPTVSSYLGYA